jgi:3-hydroxymyristoyl/3-hydroxydecanoyl-(acyl carrier protein) dehydratase
MPDKQLSLLQVKSAKYLNVIKPGEEIGVQVKITSHTDTMQVNAQLTRGNCKIAKIKLELAIDD